MGLEIKYTEVGANGLIKSYHRTLNNDDADLYNYQLIQTINATITGFTGGGGSSGVTDLSAYWTSAQTIDYGNTHWTGGTVDLSSYWTSSQTQTNLNNYSLTSHTHNQYLTGFTEIDPVWNSEKVNYYTQAQANSNFLSANTSYYTQSQVNTGFLSANTSFYTQLQINTGFLSANTSLYTRELAAFDFLSANTSYVTSTIAAQNFLSANTSYYTQSQVNTGFLSANTSVLSYSVASTSFLSASTSVLSYSVASTSFLSASTSYYTQSQVNIILSGYSLTSHTHLLGNLSNVNTTGVLTDMILKYSGATWISSYPDFIWEGGDPASIPSLQESFDLGVL